MRQDKCKLCGESAKLVKSHIIPESFYSIAPQSEGPTRVFSNARGVFPRRKPAGIWSRIVCQGCEARFGPYDDYAARLLLHESERFSTVKHSGKTIAYVLDSYDYDLLFLFFVSVLWRAWASDDPFFSRVSLGPYERSLRETIYSGDADRAENVAVLLAAFPGAHGMLDPHRERKDGVNFVRFYLDRYVAYIKVDQRPVPAFMTKIHLTRSRPLVVIARNSSSSSDLNVMRAVVKANEETFSSITRVSSGRKKARR